MTTDGLHSPVRRNADRSHCRALRLKPLAFRAALWNIPVVRRRLRQVRRHWKKQAGTTPLIQGVPPMAWFYLFIAGISEIGWALGMKYTEGFTKPVPTVLTLAVMAVSIFFLGLAVKHLPLGTAYAIWTGIGTIGTVVLGIWLFNEPSDVIRLGCIGLIVTGIIGLKLVS
jgi:quaternary ammonium compound-resistance protein SugE